MSHIVLGFMCIRTACEAVAEGFSIAENFFFFFFLVTHQILRMWPWAFSLRVNKCNVFSHFDAVQTSRR